VSDSVGRSIVRRPILVSFVSLIALCGAAGALAQITVSKVATTPVISSGDPVGYFITVTNLNPIVTASGTISDTLPAGATWTQPAGCSLNAQTRLLQCSFAASANGGVSTVSVTGTHTAGLCANLVNTASASSNNGNNASSPAAIFVFCPELHLLKVADALSVLSASPVGFTYAVQNQGLGVARALTLNDPLPAGSWSIIPSVGGCQIDLSGHLACSFGDVGPKLGRSVHVTAPTVPSTFGTFGSQATAHATNAPADATSSASAAVKKPGDADGTGNVDVVDVFYLINFLFAGGPAPP
jgi:hypothetical protein